MKESSSPAGAAGCPFHAAAAPLAAAAAPGPSYSRPWWRPRDPAVDQEIASLDAQRDCQRIVQLLTTYQFPFDILRANELALFHTFGSRSISRLLHRTGEFNQRGQKRYDDTRLLIFHFMEGGWGGEEGRRALMQMNFIHSHFKIPNEDYLFTLWTFIDFPVRWIEDFGWRRLTQHEKDAWFNYWREVGEHMGMTDLPATRAAFDAFANAYEQRELVPDPASHSVAQATIDVMAAWLPRPLRGLVGPIAMAMARPQLVHALGFAQPPAWVGPLARGALRLRRWAKRYVSLEAYPETVATSVNRTYPGNTYRIEELGPEYARKQR
jgi:hypothetical protein